MVENSTTVCPVCGKEGFFLRKDLIQHMMISHCRHQWLQMASVMVCFCGLRFTDSMDLEQHLWDVGDLWEHWLCSSLGVVCSS